jgi:hypothetical protein
MITAGRQICAKSAAQYILSTKAKFVVIKMDLANIGASMARASIMRL